jgi:hypothetical protein
MSQLDMSQLDMERSFFTTVGASTPDNDNGDDDDDDNESDGNDVKAMHSVLDSYFNDSNVQCSVDVDSCSEMLTLTLTSREENELAQHIQQQQQQHDQQQHIEEGREGEVGEEREGEDSSGTWREFCSSSPPTRTPGPEATDAALHAAKLASQLLKTPSTTIATNKASNASTAGSATVVNGCDDAIASNGQRNKHSTTAGNATTATCTANHQAYSKAHGKDNGQDNGEGRDSDQAYRHQEIKALSAVLRLGRAGAATDHSSILFDVDLSSGEIKAGCTNAHWCVIYAF